MSILSYTVEFVYESLQLCLPVNYELFKLALFEGDKVSVLFNAIEF